MVLPVATPPAVRAVLSYQRRRIPCYSLLRQMNSLLRRQTFPAPIGREFMYKALKSLRELTSRIAKMAGKIANSLLFSLPSGNARAKVVASMKRRSSGAQCRDGLAGGTAGLG